jgi:hypothetical protein
MLHKSDSSQIDHETPLSSILYSVFILMISNGPVILSQAKAYNQFHIISDLKNVTPICTVIQNANTSVRQNNGPTMMLMKYILTKQ